jgi:hypothetical protein
MNARYHAAREGFLDNVHRWFMFAVIALGAGALVDVGVKELSWAKDAFAACAAIIAALDLTFDLSNRARTHSMMKRRYFELLADFGENKRNAEETRACINRFGADEEPVYHALWIDAWNAAQEMVYGSAAYHYQIPRTHRWLRQLLRYGGIQYALIKGPSADVP